MKKTVAQLRAENEALRTDLRTLIDKCQVLFNLMEHIAPLAFSGEMVDKARLATRNDREIVAEIEARLRA